MGFLRLLSVLLGVVILISSIALVLLVALIALIVPIRGQILVFIALPSRTSPRFLQLLVELFLLLLGFLWILFRFVGGHFVVLKWESHHLFAMLPFF